MLDINIEKLRGGWLYLRIGNEQKQHTVYLSTLDIYFMPSTLFYSVIDLIKNDEESLKLKLDEEGHHYFLFLIKENQDTLKYYLCDPSYGEYDDYYTYITDKETEPYILHFMYENDVDMEFILKGKCSCEDYYRAIYYPFKNLLDKYGLEGFKELAMSDFPLETYEEMRNLFLKKGFIKP